MRRVWFWLIFDTSNHSLLSVIRKIGALWKCSADRWLIRSGGKYCAILIQNFIVCS